MPKDKTVDDLLHTEDRRKQVCRSSHSHSPWAQFARCSADIGRWVNQAAVDLHWQEDYTKVVLAIFEEHLVRPLSQAEDVTYLSDMLAHSAEH